MGFVPSQSGTYINTIPLYDGKKRLYHQNCHWKVDIVSGDTLAPFSPLHPGITGPRALELRSISPKTISTRLTSRCLGLREFLVIHLDMIQIFFARWPRVG